MKEVDLIKNKIVQKLKELALLKDDIFRIEGKLEKESRLSLHLYEARISINRGHCELMDAESFLNKASSMEEIPVEIEERKIPSRY